MAFVYCPECGAKVSERATTCPRCGYRVASEGGIVPFSSFAKPMKYASLRIPEAELFGGDSSLVPDSVKEGLGGLLADARQMERLAPNVYQAIEEAMRQRGSVWAANFSKAAEKMMANGELVLGVDGKTGDFLPQLREAETGRVYETARLRREQLPDSTAASLASLSMQMTMVEVLAEIKDVAAKVEGLRLEVEGDRIGRAKGVWMGLEQASRIRDAGLRERQMLNIAAAATEQRGVMQENFEVLLRLASSRKENASTRGNAASAAINDLAVIALMARTEYVAFTLADEPEAARAAIGQLGEFVERNRLDDRQTLLRINSKANTDLAEVEDSFLDIIENVKRVNRMEGRGPAGPRLLEGK